MHKKACGIFCLLMVAILLTGCSVNQALEKGKETVEEVKNTVAIYQDEKAAEHWCKVIDDAVINRYNLRDAFGDSVMDAYDDVQSLEDWQSILLDYAPESWDRYDLVETNTYENGMMTAEFTMYVDVPHNEDVSESTVKYHLFFVVHTEEEEIAGLRGIWSISLVDDDLYQQENFSFGAAPTASQQEDGESICGFFVGEDALSADSPIEIPDREEAAQQGGNGPTYQRGPVTVSNGSATQSYSEEIAEEMEVLLNENDQEALLEMCSSTMLYFESNFEEELSEMIMLLGDNISFRDIKERHSTGSTSTRYLFDSTANNHVQGEIGDYYSSARAVLETDTGIYCMVYYSCTNYEINPARLGIYRICLYEITEDMPMVEWWDHQIMDIGVDDL